MGQTPFNLKVKGQYIVKATPRYVSYTEGALPDAHKGGIDCWVTVTTVARSDRL